MIRSDAVICTQAKIWHPKVTENREDRNITKIVIQNIYLTLNRIGVEVNFFDNAPLVPQEFITDFTNMLHVTAYQHKPQYALQNIDDNVCQSLTFMYIDPSNVLSPMANNSAIFQLALCGWLPYPYET